MSSEDRWPISKSKLGYELQESGTCVTRSPSLMMFSTSDKIIIPAYLRQKVTAISHEGHQEMSKCKSRIREFYWWLYQDVEDTVRARLSVLPRVSSRLACKGANLQTCSVASNSSGHRRSDSG